MRHLFKVLVFLGLTACPAPNPPLPIPVPPQAFITVDTSDAVDVSVKGTVSTSGCRKVVQVRILANDTFLADANYTTSPTRFELPRGVFNALYKELGLALNVNLSSEVECDDGRKAVSQPVNVRFLPVESLVTAQSGLAAPETFIAQGGLGGEQTTFIGCVGTPTGPALQLTSAVGTELKTAAQFSVPCSTDTVISKKNAVTGLRWMMERGKGVVAFDKDLNQVNAFFGLGAIPGNVIDMAVAKNGDAIVLADSSSKQWMIRVSTNATTNGDGIVWAQELVPLGRFNAAPVVDSDNGLIWFSMFRQAGTTGETVVYKHRFSDGAWLNNQQNSEGTLVYRQQYPPMEQAIVPAGFFSANGSTYYLALPALDTATNTQSTFVFACVTGENGCQVGKPAQKWASAKLPGLLSTVVPFSGGTYVSVSGSKSTYFLSDTDGKVVSLAGQPLVPEDDRFIKAVEPGKGTDFYVLTGPRNGTVSEIIATDKPESGVLWRVAVGAGNNWAGGDWLAVDDAGNVWIRVQNLLVKALKATDYRAARGPTPVR